MQNKITKVAMPISQGNLCLHFGHCEQFAIFEIENKQIKSESVFTPPAHTTGAYPKWLASHGVEEVLVGGIGAKAIEIFEQNSIKVSKGLEASSMSELIKDYLKGDLQTGDNSCNHDDPSHEHHQNCAH